MSTVKPTASQSIRQNSSNTAQEAYTPSGGVPTTITAANESSDTTCFPAFFTAATGDLAPKTNANLGFNSATGALSVSQLNVVSAVVLDNGDTGSGVTLQAAQGTPGSSTATIPQTTGNVIIDVATQTLTNKTLTSPTISSPTFSTAVGFGAKTAYFTETDNGNSSTTDTIDWGVSNKQKSTLTGNCTFTFTAPPGPCSLILKLVQDGTGSRTVTWPATVHWPAGTAPTLTTTASKVDIITFYWDGTTYFGNSSLNFTA